MPCCPLCSLAVKRHVMLAIALSCGQAPRTCAADLLAGGGGGGGGGARAPGSAARGGAGGLPLETVEALEGVSRVACDDGGGDALGTVGRHH